MTSPFTESPQTIVRSLPDSNGTRYRQEQRLWLAVAAGAAMVQLFPAGVGFLQFDRAAITDGEWWRLITGNFVHYDWTHTAVNLGVFAVLCWLGAGDGRSLKGIVAASAGTVGLSLYFLADGVATYRGISGVDFALLAWLLVRRIAQEWGWKAFGWLAILLVLTAKSVVETVTGQVLLPTSAPAGVEVVGIIHIAGLATGSVAGGVVWWYGSATQGRFIRSRPAARSSW